MTKKSLVTGLVYDTKAVVHVKNPKQAAKYVLNGCTLYDLLVDEKSVFTYVFDREEASYYYARWLDGTL
ncbi:MAG: hypothetical protein IJG15_03975 [Lachnospiraceae bacterium]|nr:hypothetical protein [Lachnospiraceae bacterium]